MKTGSCMDATPQELTGAHRLLYSGAVQANKQLDLATVAPIRCSIAPCSLAAASIQRRP